MVDQNSNAVAAKTNPLAKMLAQYKKAIQSVLPKHLTPERILRIAHMAISRNPKLMGCTEQSLINGIIQGSVLGLEVGTGCHLVPFYNNRIQRDECVFIPDYKGLIDLAHRSNRIQSFPFKPVYMRDEFSYSEGTDRHITHVPCREEDRGVLVAAYAIVFYKHGGYDFEVVEKADAMAAKKRSMGARMKDSPWNQPDMEPTMWCKTAVKRLVKRVPMSPELQFAAQTEDQFDSTGKQLLDIDVIPMDAITDGSDDKPRYEVKDAPEEEPPGETETDGSQESSKPVSTPSTPENDPLVQSGQDLSGKQARRPSAGDNLIGDPVMVKCKQCGVHLPAGKGEGCIESHTCQLKDTGSGEKMYALVGAGGGTKEFTFQDMMIKATQKKDIEPTWEAYLAYANLKKETTFEGWANNQVKSGVWKYAPADIIEKLLKKFKRMYGKELVAWTKGEGAGQGADLNEDPSGGAEDPGHGTDGWRFPLEMTGDDDMNEALKIINDMAAVNEAQLRHAMTNGATDPNDGTVYPACLTPTTVDEYDNIIMAFHAITRTKAANG